MAIDEQQVASLDLGIEVQFISRPIVSTGNFNSKIRPTNPMRVSIDRLCVLQENDGIWTPKVLLPIMIAIGGIDAWANISKARVENYGIQDRIKSADKPLMLVIGHWRHHVHALPDFVVFVCAICSALCNQPLGKIRVGNESCHFWTHQFHDRREDSHDAA